MTNDSYEEEHVTFFAQWVLGKAGGDPLKAQAILGLYDDGMSPDYRKAISTAIWDSAS
jgi:hypothetical protein